MIVANDATVKGGTYYPMTVKKHLRAQEIALQNRLPCIYLVDSGGAFLPQQDEVFPDREHFGRIFYNQANMSAAGIPQIAVVMGSCTAGGAYVPAMSDETIIVREPGHDLPRRPAAGEGRHRRGGHAPRSWAAATCTRGSPASPTTSPRTTRTRCAIARRIVANLNRAQAAPVDAARASEAPLYDPQELYGIIPADTRKPFDVREIIARLVDGSRFDEFKARYGTTLVTGFARIHGIRSASSPTTASCSRESALKGAHFIELCAQRSIPLLFLQNITGFMVGRKYENGGIAKDGAKMVTAVATRAGAEVHRAHRRQLRRRQLRHVRPRLRAALPVDVAERAHLRDGRRAGGQRAGHGRAATASRPRAATWSAEEEAAFKAPIRAQYETQGHPYYATARLWDDGVIDPAQTRARARPGALGGAERADPADQVRRVPDVTATIACSRKIL